MNDVTKPAMNASTNASTNASMNAPMSTSANASNPTRGTINRSSHNKPIALLLGLDQRKLPELVFSETTRYLQMEGDRERRRQEALENFGKPGRDPSEVGPVVDSIIAANGWQEKLANVRLNNQWAQVVGDFLGSHTEEVEYLQGVVTVYAESSTWASHFLYMSETLRQKLQQAMAPLEVKEVRVLGPRKFTERGGYIRKRRKYPRK